MVAEPAPHYEPDEAPQGPGLVEDSKHVACVTEATVLLVIAHVNPGDPLSSQVKG